MRSLFILLLLPSLAFAVPSVTDTSLSTIQGGGQVTITGTGFGASGPNLLVFDDFGYGIAGEDMTTTATVGSWSYLSVGPYRADGDNIVGMLTGTGRAGLRLQFEGTRSIFISYRVKIPIGYVFPGASEHGVFPPGSQWKLAWMYNAAGGHGGAGEDVVLPTYPDGTWFSITGNAKGIRAIGGKDSPHIAGANHLTPGWRWFGFDQWNRFSAHLKAGEPDPTSDAGYIWSQGMSPEFGQYVRTETQKTLFNSTDTLWDFLTIQGWTHGSVTGETERAYYDDIYFATGPNAAARVEIGNAAVYTDTTKLAISTPDSWADTSITTTIREGVFAVDEEVYLFVINADNEPSAGYGPLTMAAPLPPVDATCSTHPSLCLDQSTCETATWYWYNDTCNTQPEPTCSTNPSLCLTELECTTATPTPWIWGDDACWDYWEPPYVGLGRSPFHPSSRARYSPTSFSPFVAQ